MVADTKLYEILGVSPDASEGEIKKQYKKLARQYHPDKAGPQHEEKFKEISFAHEVLTNPEKRQLYDRYGPQGLEDGGGMGAGMEDLLSHIFGGSGGGGFGGGLFGGLGGGFSPFGMMGGHGRREQRKRRGQDMVHPLRVTLEDLHNGKVSKLKLKRNVLCASCKGVGGRGNAVHSCSGCNGNGIKISIQPLGPGMVQQVQRVCPDCGGEGEVIDPKNRCKVCNGKKVTEETKILEVQVQKGMQHNQKITFRGEGDQQPNVETGDVVIVLQQLEHEMFTRKGDDLHMSMTVGITEALCGFKIPIKHLDDRELLVTSKPGNIIEPGCRRILFEEGMPTHRNPQEKGNLFITFEVAFPKEFADLDKLKGLERLLPRRSEPMDVDFDSPDIMPVTMHDHEEREGGRREAYNDDSDEEEGGPQPGVSCATQ